MIDISESTWENLVQKVEPSTVAEGEINEISLGIRNGGVEARTTDPYPKIDDEYDSPEERLSNRDEEVKDRPENEKVFIYEDLGLHLKSKVQETMQESIVNTPAVSSTSIRRCIATEDGIEVVVNVGFSLSTNQIYGLADALVEEDYIDDPDRLAYGEISSMYYVDDPEFNNSGWRVDGTLHRYTDEPYEMWSAGSDTDYPENLEEWHEFASDTEAEKEQSKNRDKYLIHFHPTQRYVPETNPIVEWCLDVEEQALERISVSDNVEDISLRSVSVDATNTTVKVYIVL